VEELVIRSMFSPMDRDIAYFKNSVSLGLNRIKEALKLG